MTSYQLKTPVAFIIFNRPDTTERVFAEIAKAKPLKLLVIADGPRTTHPDDAEKCAATREVINHVDWDCEVLTNYSEMNMGCKLRVSSGLDWVFKAVDEAIILEDDCLPHPDFFRFCEELLNYYRHDERVMHIGGNNFLCAREDLESSYYFSTYSQIWGWATWKRAWKYYDVDMKRWPTINKNKYLSTFFKNKTEYKNRIKIWQSVYDGKINSWAYPWFFAILTQNGISILPKRNLISNIGFGDDATHTTVKNRLHSNLKTEGARFPLNHPEFMMRDSLSDDNYIKMSDAGKSNASKILDCLMNSKLRCITKAIRALIPNFDSQK